jgi:hypothetical protein
LTGVFGIGGLPALVVVSQCFASKARPGNRVRSQSARYALVN